VIEKRGIALQQAPKKRQKMERGLNRIICRTISIFANLAPQLLRGVQATSSPAKTIFGDREMPPRSLEINPADSGRQKLASLSRSNQCGSASVAAE